jgi:hypothetical protein
MTKKRILAVGIGAIALAVAVPVRAANITAVQSGNWNSDIWDGADADSLPDPGLRPVNGDSALTSGTNTAITLNSDVIPSGSVGVYQNRSNGGSLTVTTGGILAWTGISEVIRNTSASIDATGSITITGGTLTGGSSSSLDVARVQSTKNATGTVTQSGGTLTTNILKLTDVISSTGTPSGTYNLSSAGALNVLGEFDPGPGTSAFNFTGGTLQFRGTLMNLTNAGGTLKVGGAGGTQPTVLRGVGGADTTGFNYTQTSGTINFDINSLTDFSNIYTKATHNIVSGSNNVSLAGTMNINVASGGSFLTDGTTYDIITTANILNSSILDTTALNVVGLTSGSFSKSIIDNPTGSDILRLTYSAAIPEPASLSLLSIGGLMLLKRRRRHA